jgi:four helix bundle protein
MGKVQSFTDLIVWQKSHELTLQIYSITKKLPAEERFGLVSQMRRASVSISANIAEGFKRRGPKDKANFYNISQSSLSELDYYLILIHDLGYVHDLEDMQKLVEEIGKMLNSLISSIINSA